MLNKQKKIKTYTILYIQGGGVRLLIPQHLLVKFREKTGFHIIEGIDAFGGPSSGSITAAALNTPKKGTIDTPRLTEKRLLTASLTALPQIFPKSKYRHALGVLIKNLRIGPLNKMMRDFQKAQMHHNPDKLKFFLTKLYNGRQIKDLIRTQTIPARHIGSCKHVQQKNARFRTNKEDPSKSFHEEIKIVDAVMASTAVPLGYPSYKIDIDGREESFIDGSLFEHPLFAYLSVKRSLPDDVKIRMIILGTGHKKGFMDPDNYDVMTPFEHFGIGQALPLPSEYVASGDDEKLHQLKEELGDNLAILDLELEDGPLVDKKNAVLVVDDSSPEVIEACRKAAQEIISKNQLDFNRAVRFLKDRKKQRDLEQKTSISQQADASPKASRPPALSR